MHSLHFNTCDLFEIMENGQRILQKFILISTHVVSFRETSSLWPLTWGFALGPHWGQAPRPLYMLVLPRSPCEVTKRGKWKSPPVKISLKRLCGRPHEFEVESRSSLPQTNFLNLFSWFSHHKTPFITVLCFRGQMESSSNNITKL